jgi:predicted lipoprotein with Yx(FWY)xxD motif
VTDFQLRVVPRRLTVVVALAGMVLLGAACSSSSKTATSSSSSAVTTSSSSSSAPAAASSAPGAMFSTAKVGNLGTVLVDGRGHTVYMLTADGKTNTPCTDDSGCTKVWPDLPLPDGVTSATAGAGVQASLLATMPANGETYPTYHGWLLYEFAGDSGAGQGNGEGIHSFGGTWYALDASGQPVMPASATSSSSSGY